ncbi:sensor histidine kinase [Paenibacillus aquistagni]|uniref:sensor histidine kinase n=1 Tax=Paenibacillus aquistagni TaxID=1852522 RepID=UPI00145AE881|nr:sensor histidine kinase [Paenibacillus aquistagni]NMM53251.1 histidine kinase [Paenibacillus aquistagni]
MNTHLLRRISSASFFVFILGIVLYLGYVTVTYTPVGPSVKVDDNGEYRIVNLDYVGYVKKFDVVVGDVVVEVNGYPTGEHRSVYKYGTVENADNLLIRKQNGTLLPIDIPNNWRSNLASEKVIFDILIPTVFLIIFSLVGLFLYIKCRHDQAARILNYFFLAIGISYFSAPASYRCDPVGRTTLFLLLPSIPYIFMYFMQVYLKRFQVKFMNSKLLLVAFSINMLILTVHFSYSTTDLISGEYFRILQVTFYILLTAGYGLCVHRLVSVYLHYRNTPLRPLFKTILAAQVIAFTPFVTMNLIPLILLHVELISPTITTLFLLILPFSYMYLFTSNRLFDIDFIFTRFKYYTLLSVIPAITILLFLYVVLYVGHEFASVKWFQIFLVIYIGLISFLYMKEQIDHRFRPKLFKQMYSYQDSIDRYSKQMAKVMKRDDLEKVLHQEISMMLPMCRYQFVIINSTNKTAKMEVETSSQEQEVVNELLDRLEVMQVAEVIEISNGVALIVGKRKNEFHILWISNKSNHTQFNVDEMRWLKTISNYTSIVFENLYLIDSLIDDLEAEMKKQQSTSPWLLRLLFCLSENERRRLAADLHDSALQDQLHWFRKLESVLLDRQMDKALAEDLEQIKEGLLDVIHQIRETCNELRPPLLKELGVVEAIENLIDHARLQMNFSIHFDAGFLSAKLNEEQITAMYRIVQELLRNTEKHARATEVNITLSQLESHIYFHYRDDGLGMEIEQLQSSFHHMGLSGIRERVISFEGTIEFRSQPGEGFEVEIMMPITLSKEVEERGAYIDSYLIS